METSSLTLTLNPDTSDSIESRGELWLYLEQPSQYESFTMSDVYRMWMRAAAGMTARGFSPDSCTVKVNEEEIEFVIPFNVFPSKINLEYGLESTLGVLSDIGDKIEEERDFSVFFNNSDFVDLNKIYVNPSISPRTPCYRSDGSSISDPQLTFDREIVRAPESVFFVCRGKGTEHGYQHFVTVRLPLYDEEGNKLKYDEIKVTITATYIDADGSSQIETLDLKIPACVRDALMICNGNPGMVCAACQKYKYVVYFNTCKYDTVVDVRREDVYGAANSWCMPI